MRSLNNVDCSKQILKDLLSPRQALYIPDYQREFAWMDNEVRALFVDSVSSLAEGGHFLGNVICSPSGRSIRIVDGQQRATTLYLLLAVLRDALVDLGAESSLVEDIGDYLYTIHRDNIVEPRLRSQHVAASDAITAIGLGYGRQLAGPLRPPVSSYATAYSLLSTLTKEYLGCLPDPDEAIAAVYDLAMHTVDSTGFSVTTAPEEDALEVFLRTNDRGSGGLSDMDKLKGRLYEVCPPSRRAEFTDVFHEFLACVWDTEERPDRVLGHLAAGIFLTKKTPLRDITSRVVQEAQKDPIKFIRDHLLPAAQAYLQVCKGNRPDGTPCPPLQAGLQVSRVSRFKGIRPALVAARTWSSADFDVLARDLANTAFVLSLSNSNPPENEDQFVQWAVAVRNRGLAGTLDMTKHWRHQRAAAFATKMAQATYFDLGNKGARYLLGTIECHLRGVAGVPVPASAFEALNGCDIEHVMPRAYEEKWGAGGAEASIERLGNLTPLESSRNRSFKNDRYEDKLKDFMVSHILLTQSLGQSVAGGGRNNGPAKVDALLRQYPTWNSDSVDDRQGLVYELACLAFDVPKAAPLTVSTTTIAASDIFPQGRPENCMLALDRLSVGPVTSEALSSLLEGRNGTGVTARNADYALDALADFGLVERNEDSEWALTDYGAEVMALGESKRLGALRRTFELFIRTTSPIAAVILRASESERAAVARESLGDETSTSTLNHRVSALTAWDNFLPRV